MMARTLEEALSIGKNILKENNIDNYDLDAWYLMEYCFKLDRMKYLLEPNKMISNEEYEAYIELIKQRASKIPLQHITGEQEFMGLSFLVSKDVLIPRQDTEILVEEVLKVSKGKEILDVCTGSGCIIISLSKLGDIKKGIGLDISEEALKIANQNKIRLESDVSFIQSDLFEEVDGKYDIIVSNPPYIESSEILNLKEEVRLHDPFIALDGKEDGLYFYRRIIEELDNYLKPNGTIFFEIGYNQGKLVSNLLKLKGFQGIEVIKDLAGLDRVVKGTYVNYAEHFT